MATQPIPAPPDVRQQQSDQPPESMMSKVGQQMQSSQNASMEAMKALGDEIGKVATSTMKIAELADKTMPTLMGDIAKLIEIGKSMDQSVQRAMQQMKQGSSQSPEQATATSPTDAAPPMAA
jgi:hypothetical protein